MNKIYKNSISLNSQPDVDDFLLSLRAIGNQPKGLFIEIKEVIKLAQQFNQEVVRPNAALIDRKIQENPDYLAMELVEKANEWGFYTLWIPKIFGGKGYSLPSLAHFLEEIASACAATSNLIGVHYLGLATFISSWNTKLAIKICNDVLEGEKIGLPRLISLALTEPDAGTDIEETVLMDKGQINCHAKRVDGGYIVNGNKVFISNGHISRWHILFSFSDTSKPSENLVMLAVKTGTPGLSFGKIERKMGQKACPASELVFKDCFVSDEFVCIDPSQIKKLNRSASETTMQIIDYIFSASRAGVGAFGTGVARGAYEESLKFASSTKINGDFLINYEWVQSLLAEMYKNVTISRLAYIEANYASSMYGMFKMLQVKPIYYLFKWLPSSFIQSIVIPVLRNKWSTHFFRWLHFDRQTEEEIFRSSGWGSMAKFSCTDNGVKNAQLAMELMGQAGIRQENLVEKHLRDAKLMQIYEGTNQLNRINLFKCMISHNNPHVKVFEN
ncbi:medium-chain specific acyl-CoA dehydrogenase [Candidatus Magnetomorum sp. HK-1]|nr:medium-chain specific acyl-CoA dehydrogenase [Candidatus Magnetomorum sp. HK-1]